MKTFLIDLYFKEAFYGEVSELKIIQKELNDNLKKQNSDFEKIGYDGPLWVLNPSFITLSDLKSMNWIERVGESK